jgi:hypothetical protein
MLPKYCRQIMKRLLDVEDEHELPGIITPHVQFLLRSDCSAFAAELEAEASNERALDTVRNAYDFLLSFLEEFVEQATAIQRRNQALLAELLAAAQQGVLQFEQKITALQEQLDMTLLMYLDSEADRLKAAGGKEALGVVAIIRARIAAEIEKTMGEEISTLNRLLGFDDRYY